MVLNGGPWTFHNNLLILARLSQGLIPTNVPLIHFNVWVTFLPAPMNRVVKYGDKRWLCDGKVTSSYRKLEGAEEEMIVGVEEEDIGLTSEGPEMEREKQGVNYGI